MIRPNTALRPYTARLSYTASLAVCASIVVSPALVFAQDAANRSLAAKALGEGADLLEKREYSKALDRFNEAYQLVPSPKIQFNIGLANQGLARHAQAVR